MSDERLRVVVADDDDHVRALVGIVLGLEDPQEFVVAAEAHDASEAVSVTEAEQPDAVVLDLLMPGVDGLAAIPEIRRRSPRTKIVVFSAVADENAGAALSAGADAAVQKTDLCAGLTTTLHALCGAGSR